MTRPAEAKEVLDEAPVRGGRLAGVRLTSDAATCLKAAARLEAIAGEIRIETITDFQSFLDLEPVWNEVAESAGLEHPFLEYTWVRTWWECFHAESALHVLVIRAGDRPIAIAPLILTPIRMWGIQLQRLGFFYNAQVPRADFLITERPDEVYHAIWTYLLRNPCWDVLQLCQLPEGCSTLEEMSRLAAADDCRIGVWASEASPHVPLRPSWGEYLGSLTAKHRSNLRNRFKRLNAKGPVEIEVIDSAQGLADGMESGLRLEAAAWKGEAQTAICSDPQISRFYSTLAARAAERGWTRLHFLRAGRTRVAFDYSLAYKNRTYLLKLGYDPAYAPFSPSNLLLYLVLQTAFEHGEAEYDFLGGGADWKQCWARQVKPHYWLFVFPNTFKGRVLYFLKFRLVPWLKRPGLRHVRSFILRAAALLPHRDGERAG